MRVDYVGRFIVDNGNGYRLAEITFNEDKELNKVEKVVKLMLDKGWNINIVAEGYASCIVFDKDEYNDFVHDIKVCKRSLNKI